MKTLLLRALSLTVWLLITVAEPFTAEAAVVNYDIVYVRAPRFGDNENSLWPEVFHPAGLDAGADLMLLHPDGSEELLVAGGIGSVTDPFISFDGQWCYYVYFPDLRIDQLNYQRDNLPYAGSDIYRINLQTRQVQRLTFQEFTPNTGAGNWLESNPVNPPQQYNRLGYGILNLAPCPVAGGKVAFVSNRNGLTPPKNYTSPTLQLFVMDDDGENITPIAPMSIGSALHPTPLRDGRIMFTTYESQGLRDERLWGIWSIYPDGRWWKPVVSAFHNAQAFHFMTQLGNGDLIVVDYYNLNNNGFGALYRLPPNPPNGEPPFYPAFVDQNPDIQQTIGQGFLYPFQMPFTPRGLYSIVPFTHGNDEAAPVGANSVRVGKFTHPSGAPNGDLLVAWTPGPANNLNRPTPLPYYDSGIYIIRGGNIVNSPADLVLVKNDPNYNEAWPRAVVPYSAVHGIPEPAQIPWLPNDGTVHAALPRGTPYGLVGTSSFYKRESFPGYVVPWSNTYDGLDVFNTAENEQSSNWFYQGSDDGKYSNSEIFAVRIVAMEPNTHRSYGPNIGQHYVSHANERLRILGEIPLRKFNGDGSPVLDPETNPDTSFLAKIPADTPFTFQMLDKDGLLLAMAQTWHQVRPGEVRNNCGGCHAHSQQPLAFGSTAAGQPAYQPADLTALSQWLTKDANGKTVVATGPPGARNVEFLRDIRPVLQRSCVPCHKQTNPSGNLVLDDLALYNGLPGDYARLADDQDARWGYPPLVTVGTQHYWRQSNASRYVRMFQSRRSLLAWKVFGRRLDGWANADHPTESSPGNAATLPTGADPNEADLDFTGTIMPPPGGGVPLLSEDEKMNIARWIDLGCPIDIAQYDGNAGYGWFLDDLRPTLTVSSPRQNQNAGALSEIRVGMADANSGVNAASLSVKADFVVNGLSAGTELVGQGSFVDSGIFSISLNPPITSLGPSHVTATVFDKQGNKSTAKVRFWVQSSDPRQTPAITWPVPSTILYGTPLGAGQLNATANVPGTFVYTPAAGTALNAGSQLLSATFTPTDTAHYTTASATVTLTVLRAALTIRADDKRKPQGTPNPPLTATYTGFVNSDSVASLDVPVTLSTTATATSPQGVYPIVASGAVDANYVITHLNDTLTIDPAALVSIAVSPAVASTVKGSTQPFSARGMFSDGSSQDLSATAPWTSSNPAVATVNSSGLATGLAVGSVTIRAAQNGITGSAMLNVVAPSPPTFANTAAITIVDNAGASPYPSGIVVSGLSGTITKVTVALVGLTHTNPDDLDVLLMAPNGDRVLLMSDAGGAIDVNGVTLTFDDAASNVLPDSTAISTGTFKPTNYGGGDSFPAPASSKRLASSLSAFNGLAPNGTWSLFVVDDRKGDAGRIAGGWRLTIGTNP